MAGKPDPALIVLGRRAPAVDAALAAADHVVVVAPRLPRGLREREQVSWIEADPEQLPSEDLAGTLPPLRYGAVLAAAEGTVAPAARLRTKLGLPGLTPTTAARCTDKALMKVAVREAGLRCADWVVAAGPEPGAAALIHRLGLPLVVKDRVGSGGRGTRVVHRPDEVPETLANGRMAEAFVAGREISVEAFVHRGRVVWSNCTEYVEPRAVNLLPAPPDGEAAVMEVVARAVEALGVERGLTHTELYLTEVGVVFGELAARPPGGYIMPAIGHAYGFDAWRAWVDCECGRPPATAHGAQRTVAVQVLHPGAGRVTEAQGVREARSLPGVVEASLRVRVGTLLAPRLGAGQEAGHLIVLGEDRQQALARLDRARRSIRIRVEPRTS